MSVLSRLALLTLLALPAAAEPQNEAAQLVEAQLQAAAAALAVLEKGELPPAARAERLQPLANELARLHAMRPQVDAAQLELVEARVAEDAGVQQLVLRLLRAMELCAAADYAGSPELAAALHRLALAFEGELDKDLPPADGHAAPTAQSGAE